METVIDSKTLLEELNKKLLGRGKLVKEIKDCYITLGQETDWHRTDYARLWSTVSLIHANSKVAGIANGYVYSFPHLSPFVEGIVSCSFPAPIPTEITDKINKGLDRALDKKPLPANPTIQDLTKTDIENLFNYDLRWYGAGIKRTGELIKAKGYSGEAEEEPLPENLHVMVQLEKVYPSRNAQITSFYTVGDEKPGNQSYYKRKETLEHLDSWLVEKIQI